MGLTFQAMVDDALRERPENIMLPSFDEWGSPPRPVRSHPCACSDKRILPQHAFGC
jgi:hypothetical protein